MVEKVIKPGLNVVDFARYQAGRAGKVLAISERDSLRSARACRHCGAALLDGENEDDCSSVLGIEIKTPRLRKNVRKFRAD
ncbi:MAG TPA: hypothetical protein VH206_21350 [Xanthobacteraceae bacterium]|jgi:hypothetical protein|nr:hypothetical protein [Xanthobacteraceae bacterium]